MPESVAVQGASTVMPSEVASVSVEPPTATTLRVFIAEPPDAERDADWVLVDAAGQARLRISYEMVSENLDGSRKIDLRHGDVEIDIPTKEGGPASIYRDWAQHQNDYFLHLLGYYPHDTFLQYALLMPPPSAFLRFAALVLAS